jgi:hypothetical protein
MFSNNFQPKSSSIFFCKKCDYSTCKKSNYDEHLTTRKHQKSMFSNEIQPNPAKSSSEFVCRNCSKKYKDYSGLWRHNKKCLKNDKFEENEETEINKNEISHEIILNVIKQNKELQQIIIEQNKQNKKLQNKVIEICKNGVINNITNNTNSHNKTFNLQFFLNETCKNAMNITDFVNSIKLQLSDLESLGKIGYIEGLSKIIIRNLNALDITERPVHCSDSKRETMYVKDENKWEKENEEKQKVLQAIEDIANKNTKLICEWKKQNPECASSKSIKADQYSHILIEALCSNNEINNQKVLKKIAKEVVIDKNIM